MASAEKCKRAQAEEIILIAQVKESESHHKPMLVVNAKEEELKKSKQKLKTVNEMVNIVTSKLQSIMDKIASSKVALQQSLNEGKHQNDLAQYRMTKVKVKLAMMMMSRN
jgi:hypothetical protein